MSLNQNFTVKNSINTLGKYLSGGTDLYTIFAPSNTTFTVAANYGSTFTVAGGQTETFTGTNGINTSTALGTRTITISGVPATYSTVGVASFNSGNFSVTNTGAVSVANGGIGSYELGGAINNVTIGATTASTGRFTTLTATGALSGQTTIDAGTGFRVAGSAASGQYLRGDGTDFVSSAIQAADVPTLNQNTTGSAATLTTPRNIWGQNFNGSADISGNLSSVGNITGSGAITISTASNGNIILSPNGTGIVSTESSFQAASGYITGNLSVGGNLYIAGSATTINQNQLIIDDPIIYMANNNPSNTYDVGFAANYVSSGYYHTGLIRAAGTSNWYLFSTMVAEPSSNSIATNSKTIDTLVANTSGTHTGNATTATTLQTARNFSLGSGDVTSPTVSFDGSANVALSTTISNNAVTYAKFQQVASSSVIGNPTGSTTNAQSIPASVTGFALLSATNTAAAATTIGLGTNDSVTFNDVTVGGSTKYNDAIYSGSVTSNNVLTVPTFSKSGPYNTAKYIVQIKNTATGARAALEIIATYNGATTSWDGTFFGIIDTSNIFSNVDVSTFSSTVDLAFTFNGNSNYSVTVASKALTD